MPRRAKLIILGLFLVLLSIAGVQLVFTWSPEEPLRFRYVPPEPGTAPWMRSLGTVAVDLVAENHSSTPVHVFASWYLTDPPPDTSIDKWLMTISVKDKLGDPRQTSTLIPAHGSARITVDLTPESRDYLNQGNGWMGYAFHSSTKTAVTRGTHWLASLLPEGFRKQFPKPSLDCGLAPIQLPLSSTGKNSTPPPAPPKYFKS